MDHRAAEVEEVEHPLLDAVRERGEVGEVAEDRDRPIGMGLEPGEAGGVHPGSTESVERKDRERRGGGAEQAPSMLETGEVRQVAGVEPAHHDAGHADRARPGDGLGRRPRSADDDPTRGVRVDHGREVATQGQTRELLHLG